MSYFAVITSLQSHRQTRNSVAERPWQNRVRSPQPPPRVIERDAKAPAQRFERFLDLPQEIQIQVFKYALCNIPEIKDLGRRNLYSMRERNHPSKRILKGIVLEIGDKHPLTFTHDYVRCPLFGILNTNRLARQIALEFWRDMVLDYMPDVRANGYWVRYWPDCSKPIILVILDAFIDEMSSKPGVEASEEQGMHGFMQFLRQKIQHSVHDEHRKCLDISLPT